MVWEITVMSALVLEEAIHHGSWAPLTTVLGVENVRLCLLFALYSVCFWGLYAQQAALRSEGTKNTLAYSQSHRFPKLTSLSSHTNPPQVQHLLGPLHMAPWGLGKGHWQGHTAQPACCAVSNEVLVSNRSWFCVFCLHPWRCGRVTF